jgi:hypothetical protein
MPCTEIITVEGGSELRDFIDLPWRIYAGYPRWKKFGIHRHQAGIKPVVKPAPLTRGFAAA